jgi:hypothetical protein
MAAGNIRDEFDCREAATVDGDTVPQLDSFADPECVDDQTDTV